jgi:hypothetical protein
MGKRSNNSYYQSPDLGDITNNLSKIMGMSGNADSNYLTNLGKVQRLEGLQFDNNRKFDIQRELNNVLSNKDLSPTDRLREVLLDKGLGYARGQTESLQSPYKVSQQKFKSGVEENKFKKSNFMNELLGNMVNSGLPPERKEDGQYGLSGGEGNRMEEILKGDSLQRESFDDAARKWLIANNVQPGTSADFSGGRAKVKDKNASRLTAAKVEYEDTKSTVAKAIGVKKTEKLTKEIAKIADEILLKSKLNAAQVMEIKNRVLNAVAKLDQNNLTAAERRKLIKEQTNVQAQKVLEETAKAGIAGNNKLISDAELKANPGKLTNENQQRIVKLADLQAKLAREGDAGKREKIKREIAEQTKQANINKAVGQAANTEASGRLIDQRIMNALIKMESPADKRRDRDLLEARTKKVNGDDGDTDPGTSKGAIDKLMGLFGLGGGGSPAPVTRSSTAPVQPTNTLALDVFKGLEGQDIRSWSPLQIESYIKQVVAETNGAITAKQALAIFQTAAKKGD